MTTSNKKQRPLRIAMPTYSFYESDNRVRRYAETLARRGDEVDIISLRRPGQEAYNELNGVRIFRIQERVRNERGKINYLLRILKFMLRSAIFLTKRHIIRSYDLIHVHSVPDFEVFAALVPKLMGARLILDIHDIVPELYANKFQVKHRSLTFRSLLLLEKLSTLFADHVIISNDLWHQRLTSRSVPAGKCTTILNYPDPDLFYQRRIQKNNGKLVFLYPGTLNFHQGLDLAIMAINLIKDRTSNVELHIYGDGPAKPSLEKLISDLDLKKHVFLNNPVSLNEIVGIMAKADFGIIPKRNDDFGGTAFSTKTLEFMSLGIPIILSRTQIDQHYFNDNVVKFFEPDDPIDLSNAMLTMIENLSLPEKQVEFANQFFKKFDWHNNESIYINIVNQLTN